jgi:hypothetical protein
VGEATPTGVGEASAVTILGPLKFAIMSWFSVVFLVGF